MLKVALTHDIDRITKTYQYFTHTLRALKNGQVEKVLYYISSFPNRKNVYWNFDEMIEIENEYNVKSTCFFLNESCKFQFYNPKNWKLSLGRYDIHEDRVVSMIRYLDQNGWEIGLHGSYNSFNNQGLLKKEKEELESIVGHPIIGTRQHYLNLNDNTWSIQNEVGLKYDSSFGFSRNIGYKDNQITPFRPIDNEFIVFPLVIMDSCYMNTKDREEKLKELINITEDSNGVLVINWHNNYFCEKEFPGWRQAYIQIIEECLNRDAIIKPLSFFYNNYVNDAK